MDNWTELQLGESYTPAPLTAKDFPEAFALMADKPKQRLSIRLSPDGSITIPWWTPEVDAFLAKLGVEEDDFNRNPFCG